MIGKQPQFVRPPAAARALIDYLASTYDVTLDKSASPAADFLGPLKVLEAVRVSPLDSTCASLTFGFTPFPAVFLYADVLRDFAYATCGCAACDEGIGAILDRLEWTAFAVLGVNYREAIVGWPRRWVTYELNKADGSEVGRSRLDARSKNRLKSASRRLAILPGGWAAWPLTLTDKIGR